MKKSRIRPGQDTRDRYIITYADLITLLLGLFVLLYSGSQVDAKKFRGFQRAFVTLFGEGNTGTGPLDATGASIIPMEQAIPSARAMQRQQQLASALQSRLAAMADSNTIDVGVSERGVTVHVAEKLLFETGKDDLLAQALPVLDSIGAAVESLPNDVRVEGHTDTVPISNTRFPSNWHLSVARALNTAYYMMQNHRLTPGKVSIAGYGEFRPIRPNDTEDGRAKNRRVDIVVLNTSPGGDEEKAP
jgi:chemotaxis protein MotB